MDKKAVVHVTNFKLCFIFTILLLVFFMFYDCFLFFYCSTTVFFCVKLVLLSKSLLLFFFLTIIIIQISSLCITSLPAQFYCIALSNCFLNHVGEKKVTNKIVLFSLLHLPVYDSVHYFFMWIWITG